MDARVLLSQFTIPTPCPMDWDHMSGDDRARFCERCGKPIPKARLKAFPAATLDVACKQREERR